MSSDHLHYDKGINRIRALPGGPKKKLPVDRATHSSCFE